MRYLIGLVIAAVMSMALLAQSAGPAVAEYPPDGGTVSVEAEDTTPPPDSAVELTCTALDADGNPLAGVPCTFTITSNPGGASFDGDSSITVVTDENGVAVVDLETGSDPGNIVVSVEANGGVSQVTLATGTPQELPNTGGRPQPAGSSTIWPLVLIAVGAVAVAASGLGMAADRSRGRDS